MNFGERKTHRPTCGSTRVATCHVDVSRGRVSADVSMVNADISIDSINIDPVNGSAGSMCQWSAGSHISATLCR